LWCAGYCHLCGAQYNSPVTFAEIGTVIDKNLPVRVFKNLKHGCYSIMQRGVVKASAREVRLAGVEFRVREAGRQRTLREKRKNIHAFAVGRLVDYVHPSDSRRMEPMTGRSAFYDPFRFASFVDGETQAPVTSVSFAQFDEDGVIYSLDDAA
jgi:hypothetical protein